MRRPGSGSKANQPAWAAPSPTDRRSWYAVITADGRKRLDAVLPGHLALIEEWFIGRLDGDQLTAMIDALRTVRDAVRPDATAGSALPSGE